MLKKSSLIESEFGLGDISKRTAAFVLWGGEFDVILQLLNV